MKKLLITLVSISCMFLNVFNVWALNLSDFTVYVTPNAVAFPCLDCVTGMVTRFFFLIVI